MGGLGPGIGGLEILVIGLVALLVVGPKDLPVLMRKVGKAMARARAMANDFRSSFDEMARQSELDELRKEVEALRTNQMVPLGAEADKAFRDIRDDLNKPLHAPDAAPALTAPDEWPDSAPVTPPLPAVEPQAAPAKAPRARKTATKPRAAAKTSTTKVPATRAPAAKSTTKAKAASARPKVSRKKAVDL